MLFDTHHHTLVVISGELWACGSNNYGQLGLGHNSEKVEEFTKVDHQFDGSGFKMIICGDGISLVLTNAGNVFGCGITYVIAIDNIQTVNAFIQLPLHDVQYIECYRSQIVAISQEKLYFWNFFKKNIKCIPIEIISNIHTKNYKVCMTYNKFVAITDNGLITISIEDNDALVFTNIDFDHCTSIVDMKCNSSNILLLIKNDQGYSLYVHSVFMRGFHQVSDIVLMNPKIFVDTFYLYVLYELSNGTTIFGNIECNDKYEVYKILQLEKHTFPVENIIFSRHIYYIEGAIFHVFKNGEVYCEGDNKFGELGMNMNIPYNPRCSENIEHNFLSGKDFGVFKLQNRIKSAKNFIE